MGSQAGSFRKASPQTPNIDENEKRIKRLEKLKRDLQNIKNERDILQGILAKYKDLNDRTNFETFMLEMQHNQMMTDLKRMSQDISEALYKCQHLTKENQLYCCRNCHLLIESNLIQHKVRMLWKENRQLLRKQIALEECNIKTKILCKEGSQKIKDEYSRQAAGKQITVVPGSKEEAAMSNPCA
uniref:Predicted gene 3573 n=1 Tax=Mus musculus TaxID=10090 RepID=L7N292_MOUSE